MKRTSLPALYQATLFGVPVVLTGLLSVALGYTSAAGEANDALRHHNERLLERSLTIGREQFGIISALKNSAQPCSERDISSLRVSFFLSNYVADIGRIVDGRLRCSAVWGTWEDRSKLSTESSIGRTGISGWRYAQGSVSPTLSDDPATNGALAVLTRPTSFDDIGNTGAGITGKVYTIDKQIIYRQFESDHLRQQAESYISWLRDWFLHSQSVTSCGSSGGPDICAESNIVTSMHTTIVPYALFGMLVGANIGVGMLFWGQATFGARASLRVALRQQKIRVEYQPLRRLATGELVGMEALARWPQNHVDPASPAAFVNGIEKTGLRAEFTRYIASAALDGVLDRLLGDEEFYVSINIFPDDLEDPSFLDFLITAAKTRGIDPTRIALEIVESAQFKASHPNELFQRFRNAGFRIFLDDFGVGYSNLGNVMNWRVDGIKLDRIFVQPIDNAQRFFPVLDQIIEMARKLDLLLIVEGIETSVQAEYVLEHAPHAMGQGWLFGRPGSAASFKRQHH